MEFKINTKTMLNVLTGASRAIDSKPTISILGNFCITLDGGRISVVGSNPEARLTFTVGVDEADGNGRFLVDSKRFVEVFKSAPDCQAKVVYNPDNSSIHVSYTSGRFKLASPAATDYPESNSTANAESRFVMSDSKVVEAITSTRFAAGTDMLRPQMMGIYFDVTDDSLTAVATNMRVMARYSCTGIEVVNPRSVIIPSRACDILLRMVQAFKNDGNVEFRIGDNNVTVIVGGATLVAQYTKAAFPDYKRVIPTESRSQITIGRRAFTDALTRVGIMSSAAMDLVKIKTGGMFMALESSDSANGLGASEDVACQSDGPDILIGFSASMLKQAVDVIPGDDVLIRLTDGSRPGLISPTSSDIDLTVLCMPMALSE